jgi:hypothetical protein
MAGFDFLVELHANSDWWNIPVIVLTSKDLTARSGPIRHREAAIRGSLPAAIEGDRAAAAVMPPTGMAQFLLSL